MIPKHKQREKYDIDKYKAKIDILIDDNITMSNLYNKIYNKERPNLYDLYF